MRGTFPGERSEALAGWHGRRVLDKNAGKSLPVQGRDLTVLRLLS